MSNQALHLLTFALYSVLAILFWRAQAAGNAEQQNRGALGFLVIIPLALHGWLLYDTLFIWGALNLGLVYALSLILWLTVLIYWLARYFYPLSSLQTLVLPLAAVSTALPAIFPDVRILSQPASSLFDTHVLGAMLAYSLFTIAALHAALISLVEKRLHHAKMPKVLRNLPPLLTMEILLFRVIGVGFVLLSITIASGMMFSEELFGHPWRFSHKVLFGILSWGVFATLLMGHRFYGWRGHIAVRWTLSGFFFLVLAYLGTQFVLEAILHR
ncbi:cytochrome C assembly family protein [Sideroxydans lithotrophicus]|uniref:Cytochrome c assembly protein n=1 Tax=Sideroxydans lithotrophicus (strain ES-1) TaxID=580332 RepID=D5CP44_SIDLE|nr:cytochrome c biogenesis protein CcsA [Sideroxydans lithotrophicus]ADE12965.1 cytochrome c assembly protein [Sideroxydans lithotrophicus ES-1]